VALALGLLNTTRSAIDRKDFKAASAWLDAADGIAAPANIDNLRTLLAGAQHPTESLSPAPKTAEEAPPEVGAAIENSGEGNSGEGNSGEARAPSAADVVDAQRLVMVKSVQPEYPRKAREDSIQGWVELDFTVAESGQVTDLSVHAANPRGVFDQAAMSALAQWRYKPVLVDAKPVAQRARIRIRFAIAN
jgi:TonB family protein